MTYVHQAIIYLFIVVPIATQFEGERCTIKNNNQKGRCVVLDDCDYAKDLLKSKQRPQHCGFKGLTPIVCCPLITKPVPGQKIEKQCNVYHSRPVRSFAKFVVGGSRSLAKEFPHMALLGYGDKNEIQWLCGGSLISQNFVLTAAHCIISQDFGMIRWVRLGDLDINSATDDAKPQNFTVAKTYVYPEYRSNSHYHDIALIKLDKPAEIGDYIKPGCLYTGKNITTKLVATGWGKLGFLEESSSHLMKVELNYIGYKECALKYANTGRKLSNGLVENMQICAGDPDGKDTCPGDSGGPLQFKDSGNPQRLYIVGITSFGKACGVGNTMGVYTRVVQYLDWIEDIVWPLD